MQIATIKVPFGNVNAIAEIGVILGNILYDMALQKAADACKGNLLQKGYRNIMEIENTRDCTVYGKI